MQKKMTFPAVPGDTPRERFTNLVRHVILIPKGEIDGKARPKRRRKRVALKAIGVIIVLASLWVLYAGSAIYAGTLGCKDALDIPTQALCMYQEKAALAGHRTSNPIKDRAIYAYVEEYGSDEDRFYVDTAQEEAQFDKRIKLIHSCYVKKKINICDAIHAD